ncbi:hypothetical protein JCM10213_000037 [Rhodosporidiobolus nylandii]
MATRPPPAYPRGPRKIPSALSPTASLDESHPGNAEWEALLPKVQEVLIDTSNSHDIGWTTFSSDYALWVSMREQDDLQLRIQTFAKDLLESKDTMKTVGLWPRMPFQVREQIVLVGMRDAEAMLKSDVVRGEGMEIRLADLLVDGYPKLLDAFLQSHFDYPKADNLREIISPQFDHAYAILRDPDPLRQLPIHVRWAQMGAVHCRHLYLFILTWSITNLLLKSAKRDLTTSFPLYHVSKPVVPNSGFNPEVGPPNPHKHAQDVLESQLNGGITREMRESVGLIGDRRPDPKDERLKIDRNITYCSRDCQVLDYKKQHKRICAKPLLDVLPPPVFKPAGPPPPPFALRWQYEAMLRAGPPTLYHFVSLYQPSVSVLPLKAPPKKAEKLHKEVREELEEIFELTEDPEYMMDRTAGLAAKLLRVANRQPASGISYDMGLQQVCDDLLWEDVGQFQRFMMHQL